jgi:RNA polymerase sigma-70 factor (ECF subfamily)
VTTDVRWDVRSPGLRDDVETTAAAQRLLSGTDDALVRRAARGDIAAFDALMAGRLDRCYRLAWLILQNDADAADVTQEAFVAAWRKLPRLRDTAAFDGWLNRIVANAARMGRRHRTRLHEVQVVTPSGEADAPATWDHGSAPDGRTETDAVAERDAMARAFSRLREAERTILVLHHVDERPVVEVARTLGIPVGTAKSRLHAARKALERAMEAEA